MYGSGRGRGRRGLYVWTSTAGSSFASYFPILRKTAYGYFPYAASRRTGPERAEAIRLRAHIARAVSDAPDAILFDVMTPEKDDPETLSFLGADPRTARIPVIFLTAKAMASEVDRLRALGAHGVLTKPFDPLSLAANVRAILGTV